MSTVDVTRSAVRTDNWHGAGLATQMLVLTQRSLQALRRNPKLLVISLLQPMVFLILFTQVFNSLGQAGNFPAGASYVDYLMPGFLVVSGLSAASAAGVGLTTEMRSGVLARFRALPVSNTAVLFGRSIAEVARNILLVTVLLVFATVIFGFRPAGGLRGLLAALLLSIFVTWAVVWVFLAFGAWLRNPEAVQAAGFLMLFPLMFVSSMFVPVANLPGWLQAVAKLNPVTYAIDAVRQLALDLPAGPAVLGSLIASAALVVVGMAAAITGFRRPL